MEGAYIQHPFNPGNYGPTTWGVGSAFTWTFDSGTGKPTFAFGDGTVVFGAGVFTFPNTGLSVYDTNASHYLILKPGSDLTANKTLTITTGDSDRTITLSGNPTLADWFDQSVKQASSPTFANITDSGLTATRIPFAGLAGLLSDDPDLTFSTDTLSATKLISSTSITSPQIYGSSADAGTLTLTSTSHVNKATISVGRLTLSDLANADGIVFGSLGTATKGIDLSGSGLSGSGDYWIYNSSVNYWRTDGVMRLIQLIGNIGDPLTFTDMIFPDYYDSRIRINLNASFLLGNSTAIGSWVGDGVSSAGTANITDVGGAAHGLSIAVGDMVHIYDCTTASHKGIYRIVTAGATTIVLDRVLAATNTDLSVTFYKDVISIHATDATNGQMLTSWSAQNKPLQIGGTVLAATTNLTSADILIGGNIGFSQTTAAGIGAGTILTTPTAGNPGIYFKVYDTSGNAWAVPGWAIP